FLHARHFWLGALLVVLAVAGTAAGLSMIPLVAQNEVARQQYRELERVRAQQGERLKSLLASLDQVAGGPEVLRLRMEKVYTAYGLPQEPARGQGGFPATAKGAPQSIYAYTIAHGNKVRAGVQEQLQVVASFLRDVQQFEDAHRDLVALTPSICPLEGRDFVLTSPFGMRRNPFTKAIHFHASPALAAP